MFAHSWFYGLWISARFMKSCGIYVDYVFIYIHYQLYDFFGYTYYRNIDLKIEPLISELLL